MCKTKAASPCLEVRGEYGPGRQPRHPLLHYENAPALLHHRSCHYELIIECNLDVDLDVICKQIGRSPGWMPDLLLRADGYETQFYKKY